MDKRQWSQPAAREIPAKHTEKILRMRVVKHWGRLPGELVKSPSSYIFRTVLDKALSKSV